ncbi:putative Transposon TX1 [Gossypium australe]|uniref:Putative Transposon TX1 n=1 Tax=Gossypium australe TaxID=47621 RepID=A0A5B6WDV3_9ROSI|nr:putative Transposon TX1 [Gossypium australe]
MKILSWNVRGLGQPRTVRRLKIKLRHIRPQILFLMETKVTSKRMETIKRQCGFMNEIDVDAEGTRGGLSVGWREGLNLTLKSFSRSHIDVAEKEQNEMETWRFTGFYGAPMDHDRRESWELLRFLKRGNNKPWLTSEILMKYYFLLKNKREELERKDRWLRLGKH